MISPDTSVLPNTTEGDVQTTSPLEDSHGFADNLLSTPTKITSWLSSPSLVPPSVLSDDPDSTDDESLIFDFHSETLALSASKGENSKMEIKDLAELLSTNNKEQATLWESQMSALTTNLAKTHPTPLFSANNSIMPKFSGSESEDISEFLANFDRAARFYKFSDERKAEALPLSLTSTASIWFNTTPGLVGKSYEFLSEALRRQFHTETDVWLLRQKLHDRKQLPTESVSEFAASIRRLCQRIGLPNTERVTMFIQNL